MVFDRLKKSFRKFVDDISSKIATREISESELEDISSDLVIELVESDVAYDVALEIVESVKRKITGRRIPRFSDAKKYVLEALKESIVDILSRNWRDIDIVGEALKRRHGSPLKIAFFGVNGVGKTTTIAKFAYLLKKKGLTPVIVAADTFRAGAQEQLRLHSEKLGTPFIGGKYGSDPAAVAFDAVEYASKRGYRVVLIDTAGRMHTDTDLMNELRKIVRVVKPDYKVLVVDALTGNDAVEQAKFFEEAVGVDFIVLTKVDADVKGGSALSVSHAIGKPIVYIGVGQKYDDLEKFDPNIFAKKLLEGIA